MYVIIAGMRASISISEAIARVEDGIIIGLGVTFMAGFIAYTWLRDR